MSIKTWTVLKTQEELFKANGALLFSLLCYPRPWSQQCSGRELGGTCKPKERPWLGDVCGGPVVKSPTSQCRGCRFNPWLGS